VVVDVVVEVLVVDVVGSGLESELGAIVVVVVVVVASAGAAPAVMSRLNGCDVPVEALVTRTVAVEPGVTVHSPPLPLGVGTVKVMDPSDQVRGAKVAVLPGAPQLMPSSRNVT
jgi:hypothetical protein